MPPDLSRNTRQYCNKLSAPAPSLSTSSSTYAAKQAVSTLSSPPARTIIYLHGTSINVFLSLAPRSPRSPPASTTKIPPARPARHIRARLPRTRTSLAARTARPAATTCCCSATAGKKALATARPARRPACRPRAHADRRTHARQSWLLRRPARRFVSLFESARRCEGFRVHAPWRRSL